MISPESEASNAGCKCNQNEAQPLPDKPTPVLTLHLGNQPTSGHIAGKRDQILGIETPKMNLSGILPCSVTSCRKVKINIQLRLAITKHSFKNSEKNSMDQTKNFRIFDRNTDRNTPARVLSYSENLKINEDSWPMFIILIE